MARLQEFAAGGAGVGGTLLLKNYLDSEGSRSIFRPSVIHGLGLGSVMLGASEAMARGSLDADFLPISQMRASSIAAEYGMGALSSGLFSLLYPKGRTDLETPTLGQ